MRNKEPDLIENFSCGHDESVLGKNIWLPEGVLPGFNEACQDFYWVGGQPEGTPNQWYCALTPQLVLAEVLRGRDFYPESGRSRSGNTGGPSGEVSFRQRPIPAIDALPRCPGEEARRRRDVADRSPLRLQQHHAALPGRRRGARSRASGPPRGVHGAYCIRMQYY